MDVTKPYAFIGFGAMDVTKPYAFIGFGAMYVTKPFGTHSEHWLVKARFASQSKP